MRAPFLTSRKSRFLAYHHWNLDIRPSLQDALGSSFFPKIAKAVSSAKECRSMVEMSRTVLSPRRLLRLLLALQDSLLQNIRRLAVFVEATDFNIHFVI